MRQKCYNFPILITARSFYDIFGSYQDAKKEVDFVADGVCKTLGCFVNRWEFGHFEPTIKSKRKLAPYFKKYKIENDE